MGNTVPQEAGTALDVSGETSLSVGNDVPRSGRRRKSRHHRKSGPSIVRTKVTSSDQEQSEAPQERLVDGEYVVVDSETGRPLRGAATELATLPEVSEISEPPRNVTG